MVNLKQNKWLNFFILLVGLVALNVIAQYVYTRFDFTKEKKFTLTDKTKSLLQKNTKPITVTVFLDGDLPAAFKRLRTSTKDILTEYKSYSKAEIKLIFVDPLANVPQSEQDTVINNLYQNGIEPTNLNIKTDNGFTQKIVFPIALIECDGRQMPVKLLQNLDASGNYEENLNNSIQNLEYTLTSSLKKVITNNNPRIGFTEGNGELTDLQLYDAMNTLSESYEVGRVNLSTIDKAGLDKLKLLIVAKPKKAFTEAEKYKINYFVMNGGRLVWCLDQVSADLDSLKGSKQQMVFNNKLNVDDMLFMYGARINYNVIADANCAEIPLSMGSIGGQSQIQMAPWIYYPILMPDTANSLVKNIDGIRSEFTSTVDTIGVKNVKKQVVLRTSNFNKVYVTPKMFSLQMVAEQPNPKEFANAQQNVGVLLEGVFPSVFANRPLPQGITAPFTVVASSKPSKMIVIGDGDIFKNQISGKDGSPFPLGFDRYTQRNFGNKALLLNIVDYFTDDDNLIDLRNKELKIRLLDKTRLRTEKNTWQLVNVALPLALLICFAIFQHYYRKGKYAK